MSEGKSFHIHAPVIGKHMSMYKYNRITHKVAKINSTAQHSTRNHFNGLFPGQLG